MLQKFKVCMRAINGSHITSHSFRSPETFRKNNDKLMWPEFQFVKCETHTLDTFEVFCKLSFY